MPDTHSSLPVLPLRGLLIFPHTLLRFDVGRARSIMALERANASNNRILMLAQTNDQLSDPGEEDLFNIGVVAEIKELHKRGDSVQVVVMSLKRARVEMFDIVGENGDNTDEENQILYADAVELDDIPAEEAEHDVMLKMLIETLPRYVQAGKKLTSGNELINSSKKITDLSQLTDMAIGQLPISWNEKQTLLEELSVAARAQAVLSIMERDISMVDVERRIHSEVRKQMDKNQRDYYLREQIRAIHKELGEKEDRIEEIDELRKKLAAIVGITEEWREKVKKEIERLDRIPSAVAESSVLRTYIDTILGLPWDAATEDHLNIDEAEKILDTDHFALEKPKERIIEYLAVRQLSQSLKGPILCLAGPPGVGKTSLAKSVARALGRKFVRLSLGGVHDEAEIRGHRRTYIGAIPGRIIHAMSEAGVRNPVFLLDEVDKMSHDFRGDPASALLEVLDPEQNNTFSDHYLEIPFDLSQVLFITTANDAGAIPQPLLDRMELIQLSGYTEEEKLEIAKRHLLAKQLAEHGLTEDMLTIEDSAIQGIISEYTREAGVRSLERELARICRKAVKEIVRNPDQKFRVGRDELPAYLGIPRFRHTEAMGEDQVGVANGLAWTAAGGDIMPIEVLIMPGKGQIMLTGKLGEVLKESAQTALSFVRSKAEQYGLPNEEAEKRDIHIHLPEAAIPKDGPSAGITLVTALVSALGNVKVRRDVAMTGEISLRGNVLAIGGLKEKLLSAYRAGIREVIIPEDNRKDLEEFPEEVRNKMTIHMVGTYDQVLGLVIPSLANRIAAGGQ